ncbi:NLR family CARD domain-containing protein 3 isoform X2 [Macrotis lagotis]|uniref:NLR family CARD domain-containing protein 3 isoform X2 n=1 Tax=Macrotis lagotis TaxID=92651 RepID=UPI003D68227B
MEGIWMQWHHRQLVQFISSHFLEEILGSMRKREVLREEEFSLIQGATSPTQKVKVLIDLLVGKGNQAGQDFIENSTSQFSIHSTAYDSGMQKHLDVLRSKYKVRVDLGLLSEKAVPERLTNLLLVEGLTDLQLKEHDFTQIEVTRGQRRVSKTVPLERLFLPLSKVSIPPRISVTVGGAGIGKTMLVSQYVSMWVRGEISKDFSLVLPLNFWELNLYEKLSAERFIRSVFPHFGETGPACLGSGQVLLILDGLDEFKVPLDFSNTVACTDPKKEIPVDNLITNIIRGNLFPEVSVWVTSRPTAAGQIPGGLVDRMTEIRGFNEGEIKSYLKHMFPDSHDLPGKILSQIQANKALYLMCTVPSFCWLCGTVLGYLIRNGLGCQTSELTPPRTLSEIYAWYFKIALCGEGQDRLRESPRIEQAVYSGKKMMGTLGRLAFHGLLRKKLDNNQFQDNVMELLGSVLSSKDCHIQKISLAENQIHNKGAKALARSLLVNRSLTVLDLRSNSIGPQGAKALADSLKINRVLVSLSLQNNTIKDDGAKSIADALMVNHLLSILHLQKNAIGPLGAKSIADALKKNGSLKELMFSSNSVGNEGSQALAEALKVNQVLITLDLQSNSISDAGVAALTHALCSNQTLLSLNLRENSISPEGAQEIASALRSNHTLQDLDLTANLLHDEGAQAIAAAVKENRVLRNLHLQWNFIQANAAKALGQALQFNRSLISLDLQENAIGDEGMMALAKALKINTSLTALYLQVASIGVLGAQALGDALAVNRTLEVLDLRGNFIGAAGAKAMANALKINPSLRMLNLQENSLGMDGAICIATALSSNHGVQHINLQGNHIGKSGARMISETIKTNAPNCTVEM